MSRERSFEWPFLITFMGVILLLSLGTWQVYRLDWKQKRIRLLETRFALPLLDLETLQEITPDALEKLEFRRIRARGHFLNDQALKLQGRTREGKLGYHLVIPFRLANDTEVLIDRGWIPFAEIYAPQKPDRIFSVEGYIRLRSDRNFMTPQNHYEKKEIYALDPLEISKFFKIKKPLPFYIVQTKKIEEAPFPIPAHAFLSLRNFHLQYALTWYVLALALISVYILYRKRQRRIGSPF